MSQSYKKKLVYFQTISWNLQESVRDSDSQLNPTSSEQSINHDE